MQDKKIIGISSSEVMRLEMTRQRLILKMAKPEFEISTSVPYCIISFTHNSESSCVAL